MKIKTIGIIGGQGKMGNYFKLFFEEQGFEVLVSGRTTELSHKDLVKKSDLIIFSVPIDKTLEIIEEVSDLITEDKMLFDLTSLKYSIIEAMLKTKAKEVVGGHPMFGPTTAIAGQIFVLSEGRGVNLFQFLNDIFAKAGAKMKNIPAQKHDELMTVVQGLTHFTDIALARALSKTGLGIHEFLDLQSPAYRLKLIMMGRILAQDANLYGNIQIQNPLSSQTIKLLQDSANELADIVKEKDLRSFEKYFKESATYLADFTNTAMKESDLLIAELFKHKSDFDEGDKHAEIATLGPKNTYSDFACDEMFGVETSRQYCRTITEAFERVQNNTVKYALIPVENKLAGSVHESYDALWEFDDLEVVKEMNLKITHVLACQLSSSLDNLEIVRSHPQALSQCSRFLEKHRNLRKIAVASTSDAVVQLDSQSAVIVPKRSAERSGLKILAEDISNSSENFTRFYLLQKKGTQKNTKKEIVRTALAFELLKTKAGALLHVLQFFADEKLNLLKLESKPVGDEGDTIFFVDVEGGISEEQRKILQTKVEVLKVFGMLEKA